MINLWKEYNEGLTREARLVKILDKLEMMIQAIIYSKTISSPEDLKEFFKEIDNIIKKAEDELVVDIIKEIKQVFNNLIEDK